MSIRTKIPTALAALLLLAACSKTAEKEDARWTKALASVDQLAAVYPGFAPALTAQKKRAEDAMQAAKALGDEAQRVEKMSDANDLLTRGFVGDLQGVDGAEKRLRRKMTDATRQASSETLRLSAKQAAQSAERVLVEVKERLRAGAADPAAAKAVLSKVTSDLREAEKNLDRVIRDAKKAAKAAKAAAGAGAAAGSAKGAAAGSAAKTDAEKAATWVCEYCGRTNHGDKLSCEGCGAAKSSKPAKKKR